MLELELLAFDFDEMLSLKATEHAGWQCRGHPSEFADSEREAKAAADFFVG